MRYRIETTPKFDQKFKKLDKYTMKMIKSCIIKNLVDCENPRSFGNGLTSNRSGQWRYRIGSFRLIGKINDDALIILALSAGHRQDVYE